jgi:glycosyltransferase involved in cell wall biosynthesis
MGKRLIHLRTSLDRQLEKDEVDLVWFPTTYVEDCQLPFICTIFDLEHLRQPWFPEVSERGEWERREWTLGRSLPKATRVIVPNEAGQAQLERYYDIDSARILCLPHPTPDFAIAAASRSPLPPSILEREAIRSPYLFYPAQYWPHKNHVTLLHALQRLREAGTQHSLVCVGRDHGTLAHIKEVERSFGLQNVVHHLGFVTEDELVSLYQHADALVYPTLFGPENLPPLEAFALGCPVVCSDVEGAREQVGGAALLVPAMDPEAIANAVQSLSDEGTRSRLIAAGRDRAVARSAAAYVEGVVDFLDEFEATMRCWQ